MYSKIRHPIYIFGCLAYLGSLLALNWAASLGALAVLLIVLSYGLALGVVLWFS
jgi:protein-S-isoprenylcysteine O-methyltransferase Ste14